VRFLSCFFFLTLSVVGHTQEVERYVGHYSAHIQADYGISFELYSDGKGVLKTWNWPGEGSDVEETETIGVWEVVESSGLRFKTKNNFYVFEATLGDVLLGGEGYILLLAESSDNMINYHNKFYGNPFQKADSTND